MKEQWIVASATNAEPSELAELLLASSPHVLPRVLCNGEVSRTLEYLRYALARVEGQYGSGNHQVVYYEEQIIGIGSAWHDQLPSNFDRETLLSLHHFFGIEECMQILQRNSELAVKIAKPTPQQLVIGHLSTAPDHQRRGVASALIGYFIEQARTFGKTEVVVDVEKHNHSALACYKLQGFLNNQINDGGQFMRLFKYLV